MVIFGISRDGQPMTVKVQLADKHKNSPYGPKDEETSTSKFPPIHIARYRHALDQMVVVHTSARSGLMVENITPQLGEFFGVKNGMGSWSVRWRKAAEPTRQVFARET